MTKLYVVNVCIYSYLSLIQMQSLGSGVHVISPFTTGHKAEMIGRKEKTSILVKEISKIRYDVRAPVKESMLGAEIYPRQENLSRKSVV